MLNLLKKHMNVIKTCNLYLSMLTLGMSVSLVGPCLLDLQKMVGTDTQHIALIYTSRSLGYLSGAILGGIVLDLVRSKQTVLTICIFAVTLTMFGIPWSRNVETLLGFAIVNGLALGAIETGSNVFCIQLWGSGPILQALHFTFGIGGLIAPLIAAPFLGDQRILEDLLNNVTDLEQMDSFFNETFNFSSNIVSREESKIIYPFTIIGIIGLLVTILFFTTCLISPVEEERSQNNEEKNSNRSYLFMFGTITFTFLTFFIVIGAEIGYAQTLAIYAVKGDLHVTPTVGSYMTSAYWTAFTVSRLICVFLSLKISNMMLVIGDICLMEVSGVLLLFFMPNEWILWSATVIFGVGVASSYASLIGWLDTHIVVTNTISAILCIGCAAGEMVIPFIITYFMEVVPNMFAYVIAATPIIGALLLLALFGIIKKGKKKIPPKNIECYVINNEIVVS